MIIINAGNVVVVIHRLRAWVSHCVAWFTTGRPVVSYGSLTTVYRQLRYLASFGPTHPISALPIFRTGLASLELQGCGVGSCQLWVAGLHANSTCRHLSRSQAGVISRSGNEDWISVLFIFLVGWLLIQHSTLWLHVI
jgi:hypothetical protein